MSTQKPAQRIFRTVTTLNDTTYYSGGYVCPKPQNEHTPRVNPNVSCGRWVRNPIAVTSAWAPVEAKSGRREAF